MWGARARRLGCGNPLSALPERQRPRPLPEMKAGMAWVFSRGDGLMGQGSREDRGNGQDDWNRMV